MEPREPASDTALVEALRAGDERGFADLVDRYSPSMLALARAHVSSREIAEEVVQDTWLALLKGIDGFEGRSSLRTWLFRVLINIAKTRGVREKRSVPIDLSGTEGPTVSPDRFRPITDQYPRNWAHPPQPWAESPERSLLSSEALDLVRRELDRLPEQQRLVVALRDVDGYDSVEVCALLDVSAANQRVLLHRGRGPDPTCAGRVFRGGAMTGPDSMACQDFVELVTDYLEDRLDAPTLARFEAHLETCPPCVLYLQQIRDSLEALGRVELDSISADARDQLLTVFRTWRSDRSGESP